MRNVLNLDLGAGPGHSMGGPALMRRPALHHPTPADTHAWAHPYTGPAALAVFYNDGGDPTPVSDPALVDPPKPGPPPSAPAYTQDDLTRIAAKEKAQGERAGARKAIEDLAAELGFTKPEDVKEFIAAARKAEDAKKTEDQKRQEALDKREQELQAREAAAVERERAANRRAALVGLGATGDDLEDAAALLRVADDASDEDLAQAAEALKVRRPELFGATVQTAPPAGTPLPPAPGGAPAGGPPSRQTPAGKPGDRGREMARLRGHNRNAA